MIHDLVDDQGTSERGEIGFGGSEFERLGPQAPAAAVILMANPGSIGLIHAGGDCGWRNSVLKRGDRS